MARCWLTSLAAEMCGVAVGTIKSRINRGRARLCELMEVDGDGSLDITDAPPAAGRAGMVYRDLIPDRLGGAFIASHITIPEGGPVPDYVHHHDISVCTKGLAAHVTGTCVHSVTRVVNAHITLRKFPTLLHRSVVTAS